MAKNLSAQQIAQKWGGAMSSPQTQQNYTNGIQNCQKNPMALAAAAAPAYAAGVQQAVASGKFQSSLENTPVQVWKQNATAKASRLSGGAQSAQQKYLAAMNKWAPIYQQAAAAAAQVQGTGFAAAQAKWAASTQVLMAAAGKQ